MDVLSVQINGDISAYIQDRLSVLSSQKIKTDILDEAQALLLNRIKTRFLNTESTDGVQWEISEAARRRAILGIDGKTLFNTGNLYHSIQAYEDDNPDERVIGTDIPYAPYHQYGTKVLPVREFLGISDEDIELITKLTLVRVKEIFQ